MNLDGVGGARRTGVHSEASKQIYLACEKRVRLNWGIGEDQLWQEKFAASIRPGLGDNKPLGLTSVQLLGQISSIVGCDEGVRLLTAECKDEQNRPVVMSWKHTKAVATALKVRPQDTHAHAHVHTSPRARRREARSMDADEALTNDDTERHLRKSFGEVTPRHRKPSSKLSALKPSDVPSRREMLSGVLKSNPTPFQAPVASMSPVTTPGSASDKALSDTSASEPYEPPRISSSSQTSQNLLTDSPQPTSITIVRRAPTPSLEQEEDRGNPVTIAKKRDPSTRPAESMSSVPPSKRARLDVKTVQADQTSKALSASLNQAGADVQEASASSALPKQAPSRPQRISALLNPPYQAVLPVQTISTSLVSQKPTVSRLQDISALLTELSQPVLPARGLYTFPVSPTLAASRFDTDNQSQISMSSSNLSGSMDLSSPTSSLSPSLEAELFGTPEKRARSQPSEPQANEKLAVETESTKTTTATTTPHSLCSSTDAAIAVTSTTGLQPVQGLASQSDEWEKQAAVVRAQLKDLDERNPMYPWPGAIREPVPGQAIQPYGYYRNTAVMQKCWLQLKKNEMIREGLLDIDLQRPVDRTLNLPGCLEIWCEERIKDYECGFTGMGLKAITRPEDDEKLQKVQELMRKVGKHLKDGIEEIFKKEPQEG